MSNKVLQEKFFRLINGGEKEAVTMVMAANAEKITANWGDRDGSSRETKGTWQMLRLQMRLR